MNENQSEKIHEFDIPMTSLTPGIIDLAYKEANKKIDNQIMIIQNTQHIIQTMLGWLLAAIISLVGVLASFLISDGSPTGVILCIAGIIALSIPAIILWKGALYKISLDSSGAPPTYFLHEKTVSWLSGIREGQQVACKKYQHLGELQGRYDRNSELMGKIRDSYRNGIKWLAIDLAVVVIILFPLVAVLG